MDEKQMNEDFFFYGMPAVTMSVAAPTANQSLLIDAGGAFDWLATSYEADLAGATLTEATQVIPLATVQIIDGGIGGRPLSNIPVPLSAIAGDGKRPYRLPRPRTFGANTTITVNWANLVTGATVQTIRLVFHGIRRW